MAGRPTDEAQDVRALVRAHGHELHRTAAMLTGDAEVATELLASVLGRVARGSGMRHAGSGVELAREQLARQFVRSARRRSRDRLAPREGGPGASDPGDPGDVLAGLDPRQRAAAVLMVARGQTSGRTQGLTEALSAVADRHALPADEVVRRLEALLPGDTAPEQDGTGTHEPRSALPRRPALARPAGWIRHPRRWLAGATALAVALAGTGWLLTRSGEEEPHTGTASPPEEGPGLAALGWRLNVRGEPPRSVQGMRLLEKVDIDYAGAGEPLELIGGRRDGNAKFAALWCDLPPVQDDHLVVPELTLAVSGVEVPVGCAGRDGVPALTRLTPVPYTSVSPQRATVSWTGDLPGTGSATLAFYTEAGTPYGPIEGSAAGRGDAPHPAPEVAAGSAVLDAGSHRLGTWLGTGLHVVEVEVGHDSRLHAWVGSAMALGIAVDGVPVTDDGDLAAQRGPGGPGAPEVVVGSGGEAPGSGPGEDSVPWQTQDPELRDGLWLVHTPARERTFELPDEVRPAAGERGTVVVTALTLGADDSRWQVQVSDGSALPLPDEVLPRRTGPVAAASTGQPPPEWVGGFRLMGHWEVPADGLPHQLDAGVVDLESTRLVIVGAPGTAAETTVGRLEVSGGIAQTSSSWVEVPSVLDPTEALAHDPRDPVSMPRPDREPGPAGDQGLSVVVHAAPGRPTVSVLDYERVPYEEFDFAAAPRLTTSWVPGSGPGYGNVWEPLGVGRARDDGTLTFPGVEGRVDSLLITTKGKGRLRVLVDGHLVESLTPSRDGWWSSWTEEEVVSEIQLFEPVLDADRQLTIEVEGYDVDELRAELVRWP